MMYKNIAILLLRLLSLSLVTQLIGQLTLLYSTYVSISVGPWFTKSTDIDFMLISM